MIQRNASRIFRDPRYQIPYVEMEWHFITVKGVSPETTEYTEVCTGPMISQLTELFVRSGYTPYTLGGHRKDPDTSWSWENTDILWVHESAAKNVFP